MARTSEIPWRMQNILTGGLSIVRPSARHSSRKYTMQGNVLEILFSENSDPRNTEVPFCEIKMLLEKMHYQQIHPKGAVIIMKLYQKTMRNDGSMKTMSYWNNLKEYENDLVGTKLYITRVKEVKNPEVLNRITTSDDMETDQVSGQNHDRNHDQNHDRNSDQNTEETNSPENSPATASSSPHSYETTRKSMVRISKFKCENCQKSGFRSVEDHNCIVKKQGKERYFDEFDHENSDVECEKRENRRYDFWRFNHFYSSEEEDDSESDADLIEID